MTLTEIVKTWKPNIGAEFRGFRCGMCQNPLKDKAWHNALHSADYAVTVHLCDNCQKSSNMEEGRYTAFICDKCGAEITQAWHIWNKEGSKLTETHLCKACGQETYGRK